MKDAHSAESNEKSKISDFYDFYFSSYGHCALWSLHGLFYGHWASFIFRRPLLRGRRGGGWSVLHILSWEISKNSKPELMRRQFVLRQLRCFPDPQLTPQSNQLSYQLKYEGTHRQIFSESYLIKPKWDRIYRFPINLEANGSTLSSKSIGPW